MAGKSPMDGRVRAADHAGEMDEMGERDALVARGTSGGTELSTTERTEVT